LDKITEILNNHIGFYIIKKGNFWPRIGENRHHDIDHPFVEFQAGAVVVYITYWIWSAMTSSPESPGEIINTQGKSERCRYICLYSVQDIVCIVSRCPGVQVSRCPGKPR
jgi:hypothetical protein